MVDVTPPAPVSYPEQYLGDGVYATFDGYQVWLDTRAQHPIQRIAIAPEVFYQLVGYVQAIKKHTAPVLDVKPEGQ